MSEKLRITKAFGVIGICTFISRVVGLVRDMVIAFFFGAGTATDAFFIAFQIPNTFRRLMAEGSLTISFIPVFSETMVKQGRQEAQTLANTVFAFLTLALMALTLAGIIGAYPLVRIMVPGPGYTAVPGKIELTVLLTRLMFPYIFFISLVAFCMGILNSLRHFAAPAFSPVLLNLSMIFSVVILYPHLNTPVLALAVGVIAGGFLQLALQVPFLQMKGLRLTTDFNFNHPGLKKVVRLMVPAVFGSAVYQINIVVTRILASFLPEGSVSYLTYASRLLEFPLGVFVFALGTAALPSLSNFAAQSDYEKMKETYLFSLRMAMFIIIPAMVGLIVLRVPLVHILFQRGSFGSESTLQTAVAFLYYLVGLWAIAGVRLTVPFFYALQDTATPVRVGIVSLLSAILFSFLLMGPLQHGGLALALSIASGINLLLLLYLLRKKTGPLGIGVLIPSLIRTCFAAAGMGLFCAFVSSQVNWLETGFMMKKLLYLGGAICGSVAIYFLLASVLRCVELESLKRLFREREQ